MFAEICVGSSCYLRGTEKIVEMFQKKLEENGLESEVMLSGRFCAGKCNRVGVTITLDEETYSGITPEQFDQFFDEHVLKALKEK